MPKRCRRSSNRLPTAPLAASPLRSHDRPALLNSSNLVWNNEVPGAYTGFILSCILVLVLMALCLRSLRLGPVGSAFATIVVIYGPSALLERTSTCRCRRQRKMFSLGLMSRAAASHTCLQSSTCSTTLFITATSRYRGEVHVGTHKPMISKKLFDKIQEALVANGKPRKKRGRRIFNSSISLVVESGYAITAERKIKSLVACITIITARSKAKPPSVRRIAFARGSISETSAIHVSKSFSARCIGRTATSQNLRRNRQNPPQRAPIRSKSQK